MTPPHFIGSVVVEQRGAWWMLREPLTYVDTARLSVQVPAGFLTDFASIPRLFWNVAPPADPAYSAAAVVHDRLYETHEVHRDAADALFYRAMAVQGTPRWKRWVIWRAVSWFGGSAWASAPERHATRLVAYRGLPCRGGAVPFDSR